MLCLNHNVDTECFKFLNLKFILLNINSYNLSKLHALFNQFVPYPLYFKNYHNILNKSNNFYLVFLSIIILILKKISFFIKLANSNMNNITNLSCQNSFDAAEVFIMFKF